MFVYMGLWLRLLFTLVDFLTFVGWHALTGCDSRSFVLSLDIFAGGCTFSNTLI